jgi:hypothetical protein
VRSDVPGIVGPSLYIDRATLGLSFKALFPDVLTTCFSGYLLLYRGIIPISLLMSFIMRLPAS